MGDVVQFVPEGNAVGDGAVIEPDQVLEAAKGRFRQVVVLGFDAAGDVHVCSSHGSRDALWLVKRGELHLLLETE